MPLPWKKAKVSRISRLVADLQQPKSGKSLVVETGFPTSLVDLFVKNRDRLKKPSKKKKIQQQQQQERAVVEGEFLISDSIPVSNSRDLPPAESIFIDDSEFEWPENFSVHQKNVEKSGEETVVDEEINRDSNKGIKECGGATGGGLENNIESNRKDKRALIAILKIFPVVILSMSTKRLAVGITMSAFLLIFLECITKRFLCCSLEKPSWSALKGENFFCWLLKQFWSAKLALQGLIQRGFALSRKEEMVVMKEKNEVERIVFDSFDFDKSREYFDQDLERKNVIQTRRSVSERKEENQKILESVNSDRKWGVVEADEGNSQSFKMKRKILQRLMPKRLRTLKKGRKGKERENDLGSETSSGCGGGDDRSRRNSLSRLDSEGRARSTLLKLLEEEKQDEIENCVTEGKQEFRNDEFDRGMCRMEENEAFEHRISTSSIGLQTKSEMIVVEERVDIERGGKSGYLILFLIVLAGLLGGRMLALVITVASCSMLKLVWRRRKCINETPSMSS
ncbi:hypothetical protein JCGZ_27134 [Jatropha curcas]|uniref:Uncharacterized protein n=1 Tax=Jatropha curcas TaxID=180498 RepID=A0A067JV46_JATCU|nr:uncharacterized protein LOC105647203 [Jatropha curcas]KDP23865.1 hypothetical protein JCGZ_27134 [Jatropha curcas]